MRRQMSFEFKDGNYCIVENGKTIFKINGNSLKFISLDFYKGLYGGESTSTSIELTNNIIDDLLKKGNYIYNWLQEIISTIKTELPDSIEEHSGDAVNDLFCEKKIIPLYELSACAGSGFYFEQNDVLSTEYSTDNTNADYAVKISGNSMEPTIMDDSVVLVKITKELITGDIGIFYVDGDVMCKRYTNTEGKIVLNPDNSSFDSIEITKNMELVVQGKVLLS